MRLVITLRIKGVSPAVHVHSKVPRVTWPLLPRRVSVMHRCRLGSRLVSCLSVTKIICSGSQLCVGDATRGPTSRTAVTSALQRCPRRLINQPHKDPHMVCRLHCRSAVHNVSSWTHADASLTACLCVIENSNSMVTNTRIRRSRFWVQSPAERRLVRMHNHCTTALAKRGMRSACEQGI